MDMRSDAVELRSARAAVEKELHTLLLQLHSSQLEMHKLRGLEVDSAEIKKKLVSLFHFFFFFHSSAVAQAKSSQSRCE